MASEYSVLLKLGGYVGSNPEILKSFPILNMGEIESSELLVKSFPHGAKNGDYVEDRYGKHNIVSYIFKIKQENDRDDIFSFSILIGKRDKAEIYKPVLKKLMGILDNEGLLTEKILIENQQTIFEGINQEQDITIEGKIIKLNSIFKEIKKQVLKQKPELKGSFF